MKKIALTVVLSVGTLVTAMAIPANKRPFAVTMEDGSEVIAYQRGDEYKHWIETEDGVRIEEDTENGVYRVAQDIQRVMGKGAKMVRRAPQDSNTESPLNIAPRGLVILVSYKDKAFSVDVEDVKNMISADNYHTEYKFAGITCVADGSARQYFIDQSMGQYKPEFQVVGPYTLSKTMAYYGTNDAYEQDQHADEMIIEACKMAKEDGVDFSLYDNNNDGEIDFVYVIYAGYGENDGGGANSIWPHTFWLTEWYYQQGNDKVILDGKLLNTYACGNEKDYTTGKRTGIGTFCHEFSHVLGLPDLYITDYSKGTWKTMGDWDVMDTGPYNNYSNTPPAYSAYERFFMGWMKPVLLTQEAKTVKLGDVKGNVACIITATDECNMKGNDPQPNTFWIIENRNKYGWDAKLPGEGMLLTRVKYSFLRWNNNEVNNIKSQMGVDLIEADGRAPKDSDGKSGDAFPQGATEYLEIPEHEITNIRQENGYIIFDINGGGKELVITDAKETIAEGARAEKIMRNGMLLIQRGEKKYDVMGRKVIGD